MASVDELRLIRGFDAKTVAALLPYVTVLPPTAISEINVNTASSVVLAALVPGLDLATAQRIAEERGSTPYKTIEAFKEKLPRNPTPAHSGNGPEDGLFPGHARHFDRAPRAPQRSAASTFAQQDHDRDLAQAATPDRAATSTDRMNLTNLGKGAWLDLSASWRGKGGGAPRAVAAAELAGEDSEMRWRRIAADGAVRQGVQRGLEGLAPAEEIIVWTPAAETLFLRARLPTRSTAKIVQALPFALEEQLIDPPSGCISLRARGGR